MLKFVKIVSLLSLLLAAAFVYAQTAPPRIFFSDLESGPNSGGQNNNGVWVTIWGKGYGATQGTAAVTVGTGAVASYSLWSDSKIIFQLGAAAKTGSITVSVPGVGFSNSLPFTVRAGNIFFVATRVMTPIQAASRHPGRQSSRPRMQSPPATRH